MSHSKLFMLLLPLVLITAVGRAESQRTLFTVENAFPRWGQVEVGATFQATEQNDNSFQDDVRVVAPYVRYGLLENLALRLDAPLVESDPAFGSTESGIGDLELELQLRTWEDIFGYPYFIPHVSVTLPTGDEDKGLGNDDSIVEVGMTYGDKMYDTVMWLLDVSYRINPSADNQILVGHSYIWSVSERFDLITEVSYEEEFETSDESTVLLSGGMSYNWTKNLQMGAHVAGGLTGPTDLYSQVRLSYSF